MNDLVQKIKAEILAEIQINRKYFAVRVGISNRHLHVSKTDFETLFGQGVILSELKPLSQTGQFAANETVTIEANGKQIQNVPCRRFYSRRPNTGTGSWKQEAG
jgi:propanediol utilization protein